MVSGNQKEPKFRLDLDKSRAPRAYRGSQSLWEDDIKRIYRLVEQHVEVLVDQKDHPEEWPHLSIAVFGPSGSGKSSLLRTLANDVNHGTIWRKHLDKQIYSLPPMDPTTWAPTDQFLYAFLAAALEAERESPRAEGRGIPEGLSAVQLAFQEVNEYLRVVDDPGTPEEHDPLGLSLQKLERHTSGLRLKKAVGKFIEELAKEFGSEVVLLPVDDLDMVPDHMVNSLLTYQSFLTHPRLIPVFTFTDRMPEELIEAHFEKRLVHGEARRRIEDTGERLTVTQQLAGHFLTRCFPVRNRIRLGPAPARVQRAIFDYRPKKKETEDESSTERQKGRKEGQTVLELLLSASFLLFGHPDTKDAHKVRAALRPSTLRRQFQVVDAMAEAHLRVFRVPQLAMMANPSIDEKVLDKLSPDHPPEKDWWKKWPTNIGFRMRKQWTVDSEMLLSVGNYVALAEQLKELKINATWATIFNNAVWSLLNVHRDTLRELGLYLEDLYSWSPKELRSVVLGRILAQERATRRTVVDRWFNRTDYRRSQVLSLLAANVFRPWMPGEEPYGDDEIAIREQLELDSDKSLSLDKRWKSKDPDKEREQALERLSFPAPQGLLWFLNVTLGFYLPQIMARNWSEAVSSDLPLRGRMSANGWDLYHAPINAIRIADAKQEIFSCGMLFLDPRGYRHALEAITYKGKKKKTWGRNSTWGNHLLLRIWSCCGYSRGRYWAAFSLWRGLGFIGQTLELGMRERKKMIDLAKNKDDTNLEDRIESEGDELLKEFRRLIRLHCLGGLVSGATLEHDYDDKRLLRGFPRWEPRQEGLEEEIEKMAIAVVKWLVLCWEDRVFPMPSGHVWIDWRDSFIRRIHGEYILGSLSKRLNAAYLEEYAHHDRCQQLARRRSYSEEWFTTTENPEKVDFQMTHEDRFRWTAAVAAGAWTGVLLEYWRGCPPMLRMLLTCPVFFKGRERFGPASGSGAVMKKVFEELSKEKLEEKSVELKGEKLVRYNRLRTLYVPDELWRNLDWYTSDEKPGPLVPDELCIERVGIEQFASRPVQRRSIAVESTDLEIGEEGSGKRIVKVRPAPPGPEDPGAE